MFFILDILFRGYAFITFTTRDEALEAVKQVKLISKLWRNQLELIPFLLGTIKWESYFF